MEVALVEAQLFPQVQASPPSTMYGVLVCRLLSRSETPVDCPLMERNSYGQAERGSARETEILHRVFHVARNACPALWCARSRKGSDDFPCTGVCQSRKFRVGY